MARFLELSYQIHYYFLPNNGCGTDTYTQIHGSAMHSQNEIYIHKHRELRLFLKYTTRNQVMKQTNE